MNEKSRCSILFHFDVPGGKWRMISVQKSEQTGTGFRSKAAGDFGGKRHLISLQSGT
jgi:hypothetical protein